MAENKTETKSNTKTYLKRTAAVASLLAIVLSAVSFLQYYLCIPMSTDLTRVIQFSKEPDNSIDVLLIGSSQTYSGFSSAYAYGKFGFTSYPLAISGSSCTAWKPAVRILPGRNSSRAPLMTSAKSPLPAKLCRPSA